MNYKFAETIELGYIGLPGKCLSRFVGDDGQDYWLAKEPAGILGYASTKHFTELCSGSIHAKALELQLGEKGPVGISPYGASVLTTNQLYRGLEVRACLSGAKIFAPGQTREKNFISWRGFGLLVANYASYVKNAMSILDTWQHYSWVADIENSEISSSNSVGTTSKGGQLE